MTSTRDLLSSPLLYLRLTFMIQLRPVTLYLSNEAVGLLDSVGFEGIVEMAMAKANGVGASASASASAPHMLTALTHGHHGELNASLRDFASHQALELHGGDNAQI